MSSNSVKNLYGRIMPSSKKQINDKVKELGKKIEDKTKNVEAKIDLLEKHLEDNDGQINNITFALSELKASVASLEKEIPESSRMLEKQVDEINSLILRGITDLTNKILQSSEMLSLQKKVNSLQQGLNTLQKQIHLMDLQEKKIHRAANETVWSEVFHDAIIGSDWLKNQTFYPGRWAAGYPFLYALYRCLNEMQPMSILELGLGQTTRVIAQYAAEKRGCRHIVTEHDAAWIDFFTKSFSLSDNTQIQHLDIRGKSFGDDDNPTVVYDHFAEAMEGKKFDLISIDAPFGGVTLEYSRMDILQIIPQCLNDSFVILLDDYDRKGEKNMVEQMKIVLENHNIEYATGLYWGNKDTFMIASSDMKFLCTM